MALVQAFTSYITYNNGDNSAILAIFATIQGVPGDLVIYLDNRLLFSLSLLPLLGKGEYIAQRSFELIGHLERVVLDRLK